MDLDLEHAPWLDYDDPWFGRSYIGENIHCTYHRQHDIQLGWQNKEIHKRDSDALPVASKPQFDMQTVVRQAMRFKCESGFRPT